MTTNPPFVQCRTVWGRLGKTSTNALLGLMLVAFFVGLSGAKAQAQSADSVCRENGFQANRENLNGLWQLTFSTGTTRYINRLAIKGNAGVSMTEYYDSRLRRKRRIKQIHVLCQSTVGVVILGYRPTDADTGETGRALTYSADNFVISRQPDGKVVAFNRDDAGTMSEIDIEFIKDID